MRFAYFLIFWLLDVVPGFGCGEVVATEQIDASVDVHNPVTDLCGRGACGGTDASLSEVSNVDTMADTGAAAPDGHQAEASAPDAPSGVCTWDPHYPWTVMPCADGVHAVCCYIIQNGTCDGRQNGCSEGGRECVLQCP